MIDDKTRAEWLNKVKKDSNALGSANTSFKKDQSDNFDEYDYIEEIEEYPYGTDAEEFSNGLGDGSLDIYKTELIDGNSKKVLKRQDF